MLGLRNDFDVSTDPVDYTIYSMNLEIAKGPNLQRLVSSFLALIAMNLTFSGFVITTLLLLLSLGPLSGGGPVSGCRLAAIMPSLHSYYLEFYLDITIKYYLEYKFY